MLATIRAKAEEHVALYDDRYAPQKVMDYLFDAGWYISENNFLRNDAITCGAQMITGDFSWPEAVAATKIIDETNKQIELEAEFIRTTTFETSDLTHAKSDKFLSLDQLRDLPQEVLAPARAPRFQRGGGGSPALREEGAQSAGGLRGQGPRAAKRVYPSRALRRPNRQTPR